MRRATAGGQVLGEDQTVAVRDALRAYTLTAAASVHREHDLGSLEPGKWADLAVLDRNPLTVTPGELASLQVTETRVAGERVYTRE